MTHYPSSEEVEKTLEEWIDTQHGTAGWQVKLSNLISQTRLSDLEAIIENVERIELKVRPPIKEEVRIFYEEAVEETKRVFLSYLTSLKENKSDKKVNAIIDKWGVRADMLSNN